MIGAIRETVNGIRFDSRLEAEAYRILCALFGESCVKCQYVINLNYLHDGTDIPSVKHRVDFAIVNSNGDIKHLIEIKGQLTGRWHGRQEYAMILNLLRASRPDMFNVYQVWVGDKTLSFFEGKVLPFARRFPYTGISAAREHLKSKNV